MAIFVALDYQSIREAKSMVDLLGDEITHYKIGLSLLLSQDGHVFELAKWLNEKKKTVFIDMKLTDIPNTMCNALTSISNSGASYATVMMPSNSELTLKIIAKQRYPLKILGVTELTGGIEQINLGESLNNTIRYAKLAYDCGLDGVICSGLFANDVRSYLEEYSVDRSLSGGQFFGGQFLIVCPGIRDGNDAKGDQSLVSSVDKALGSGNDFKVDEVLKNYILKKYSDEGYSAEYISSQQGLPNIMQDGGSSSPKDNHHAFKGGGADHLVIGRPITENENPKLKAHEFNREIVRVILNNRL